MELPTVKIVNPDKRDSYLIINQKDFDPKKMNAWSDRDDAKEADAKETDEAKKAAEAKAAEAKADEAKADEAKAGKGGKGGKGK